MKDFLDSIFDFFKSAALIWVFLIAVALLLALPTQMHEYYRVAAVEFSIHSRSDRAVSFYILAAILALIGYVSVLALRATDQRSSLVNMTTARIIGERTAASFAIALPFLGLLAGFVMAHVSAVSSSDGGQAVSLIDKAFSQTVFDMVGRSLDLDTYKNLLSGFSVSSINGWLAFMAGLAAVFGLLLLVAVNLWPARLVLQFIAGTLANRSAIVVVFLSAIFAASSYIVFHDLTNASLVMGTFGFLTLSLGFACGQLAALACLSRRVNFPFCFLVLVWPIAIAFFGLADNDEIPAWQATAPSAGGVSSEQRLSAYLEPRLRSLQTARATGTATKPVPIYVVSAPGGGLYASFFVSTVLTHATEAVPAFRKHLLAISAVSGGALGSALYSALYQNNDACQGYIAGDNATNKRLSRIYHLRRFHEYDFLAPVTGALLFLDSVQAYWPRPLPSFDRARALEGSIRDAWEATKADAGQLTSVIGKRLVVPGNLAAKTATPLDCPLGSVFKANATGPAILFNVTEVGTGRQRVISPFKVEEGFRPSQTANLKLVTAAALSARFPYITPPGWFRVSRERGADRVYLVDGGYYENSGVATAQALVRALQKIRGKGTPKSFVVRLIALVGPRDGDRPNDEYLAELLSPIRALGRSRSARGQKYVDAVRLAMPQCDGSPEAATFDCQMIVGIKNLFYPLPLGWDMSELSRLIIQAQDGQFQTCGAQKDQGVNNAACFVDFLKQDLK